jgi:hypothetical protein
MYKEARGSIYVPHRYSGISPECPYGVILFHPTVLSITESHSILTGPVFKPIISAAEDHVLLHFVIDFCLPFY